MSEQWPRVREVLFKEERGEPIARMLKGLREHTEIIPETPQNPDDIQIPEYERIKTEAYAITAHIIEQVHPKAMEVAHRLLDGKIPGNKIEHSSIQPLSFTLPYVEIYQSLPPPEFFRRVFNLNLLYRAAFDTALESWSHNVKKNPDSYDARVKARMLDLLLETDIGVSSQITHKDIMVEYFVLRGSTTAGEVSWDVLRAIPYIFYEKYGRCITPREFHMIADSAESLVIQLSSMHLSNFSDLIQYAKEGKMLHKALYLEFPLELFTLTEHAQGVPALGFNAAAIESFEAYRTSKAKFPDDTMRLGCPARDARTETKDGKSESVVSSVYELYKEVADKFIVPELLRYTQGAIEISLRRTNGRA